MAIPDGILNYRMEQCRSCPTPCENKLSVEYLGSPDNACPEGRFLDYKIFIRNKNKDSEKLRGLGDVVAAFAQPIASVTDAILKTRLKACKACANRQDMLNELLPFNWGNKDKK